MTTRDFTWDIKNKKFGKLSRYRLSDNYVRFYLKFIEKHLQQIESNRYINHSIDKLAGWYTVMGHQFENLVLNNRMTLFKLLGIDPLDVVADNPFFQTKTTRRRGCQIDYLIHTTLNSLFICEIKFSKNILGSNIIDEVKEKIERLQKPHGYSCFPVLIHINGVSDTVKDSGFFYRIIDFSRLPEASA